MLGLLSWDNGYMMICLYLAKNVWEDTLRKTKQNRTNALVSVTAGKWAQGHGYDFNTLLYYVNFLNVCLKILFEKGFPFLLMGK